MRETTDKCTTGESPGACGRISGRLARRWRRAEWRRLTSNSRCHRVAVHRFYLRGRVCPAKIGLINHLSTHSVVVTSDGQQQRQQHALMWAPVRGRWKILAAARHHWPVT